MNEIKINLIQLIKAGLNINEYLTIYKVKCLAESIELPFASSSNWLDSCIAKGYLVGGEGICLTRKAEKLFDDYNELTEEQFDELFELYPSQTPSGRVLRSKNKEVFGVKSKNYQILCKKYLSVIRKLDDHNVVMEATKNMINSHKQRGSLNYLKEMETFINQRGWESYVGLSVKEVGGANVEKI